MPPRNEVDSAAAGLPMLTLGECVAALRRAPAAARNRAAGCFLAVRPDATVSVPVGGILALPVPANPALVGMSFYCQGLSVDPAANALGVVLSNRLAARVGSL